MKQKWETFKSKIKEWLHKMRDKLRDAKLKAKWRAQRLSSWIALHPGAALTIAITFLPSIVKIVNNIRIAHVASVEQKRRDFDWYDPALGKHIYAKRKLSPSELAEVAERNANGERITEILYSMGLIAR